MLKVGYLCLRKEDLLKMFNGRKFFKKERQSRYFFELKNELVRLRVAKKSFRLVKTPERFFLKEDALYTSRVGYKASNYFKKTMAPEDIINEYVKLLKMFWNEDVKCDHDLTPEWVKRPALKRRRVELLHPDFKCRTKEELLEILKRGPNTGNDKFPVHGDLCPVNIIFSRNGKAVGLIDLGDLHLGDRMLDVAVLSWTIRGNFGKKYERYFLDKLNLKIDYSMIEYYRLIYDLSLPEYKSWDWVKE